MVKFTFEKLLLFGFILFLFSACGNEKKLVYFQKTNKNADTILTAQAYVPKIQSGDILSIYVNSLSPEASSFFNPYNGSSGSANTSGNSSASSGSSTQVLSQTSAPGYLVDPSGLIELPLLGSLKVSGYTTAQVRDTLKSRLKIYLKEPTVLVRFLNFKISILGEVARPNVYSIPNEMITLPEALSIAGDLTAFGRRDSIQIIREVNGKKEFANVNLNNRDIFSSPYYYLHANDLVYVKPSKAKSLQQGGDRTLRFVSIGISLLSVILIYLRTTN